MLGKIGLKALFACIFLTMVIYDGWATTQQSFLQWGGLTTGIDRYWTISTFLDAYFGFLTFCVWVSYKESRWWPRVLWCIAVMALGNIAMSLYMLRQLYRLRPEQGVSAILARNT